ncbi:methyltransferase [Sinorhizobium meliloti]|uniref:methyltransferase n=1 Tax=Rhizobium meliloti TaxID=382 RepID=UPI00338EC2C6
MRLINGYRVSQCIYVAVELGVFDLIEERARTVDELADTIQCHAESLYRVLRLLADSGLVAEGPSRYFAMTRIGAQLGNRATGSPAALAKLVLHQFCWEPWAFLLETVRTGRTAFEHVHGVSFFDYLNRHPLEARLFDRAMSENAERDCKHIAECCDLSGIDTIVDIGGGQGFLLASLLHANQAVRGVLFDLPEVVERGTPALEGNDLSERTRIVSGDFLRAVPEGAGGYLLRHILHDWDDANAHQILWNCRRACAAPGKVFVIERLADTDGPAAHSSLASEDLEMMVNVGGKERTKAEFGALFAQAGFSIQNIVGPVSVVGHMIIEGAPATEL